MKSQHAVSSTVVIPLPASVVVACQFSIMSIVPIASLLDLPPETLTTILELIDTNDRLATVSTCTVLHALGTSRPHLWATLHCHLPEERLPLLAAWLRPKADVVHSLSLRLRLQRGDWPNSVASELAAVLQPLTSLICLRLTDRDRHSDAVPRKKLFNGRSLRLLPLRRLELDFSHRLTVTGNFDLCPRLERVDIGPRCNMDCIFLPRSLTCLSFPVDVPGHGRGNWLPMFPASGAAAGLRELRLLCCLTAQPGQGDPGLEHNQPVAPADALEFNLAPVGSLAPDLEVLVIDCSQFSQQGSPELQLTASDFFVDDHLPAGLRSLTVTHLGPSSLPFLEGLTRLGRLTRLCLPSCRLPGAALAVQQCLTQLQELQLD